MQSLSTGHLQVAPRAAQQISPTPQLDASWQSRTVQLVAGCPAPDYVSDDLLPSFLGPRLTQQQQRQQHQSQHGALPSSWLPPSEHLRRAPSPQALLPGYDLPMWEESGQPVGRLPSFGEASAQLPALWGAQCSPAPAFESKSLSLPDDWARVPAHCRRPRLRRHTSGVCARLLVLALCMSTAVMCGDHAKWVAMSVTDWQQLTKEDELQGHRARGCLRGTLQRVTCPAPATAWSPPPLTEPLHVLQLCLSS